MVEPLLAFHGEVVLREELVDVHDEEVVLVELLQGDGFLPEPGPEVGRLRVRAPLHLHLRLSQLALQYISHEGWMRSSRVVDEIQTSCG